MNILCVAAHPDDTELLCAGTLARYAQDGHSVTIAIFTDGSIGDAVVKPEVLRVTREKEARNAAALIGANLIWSGVTDELVFADREQRHLMIDVLRAADPRSEEHTSELQSRENLVCRLLLEKKKKTRHRRKE